MPVRSRVGCTRRAVSVDVLGDGKENGTELTESFVAENVTLVTAAFAADNLGPLHAPRPVGDLGDGARDGIEKGWPCNANEISSAFLRNSAERSRARRTAASGFKLCGNETAGVNTLQVMRSCTGSLQDVQAPRKIRNLRTREHELRRERIDDSLMSAV